MDCVQRVIQGQVDMTILPASYLSINESLRIIAYSRDPHNAIGWSKVVGENFEKG